jgi:tetratricopeptide (TPR) repeat protein
MKRVLSVGLLILTAQTFAAAQTAERAATEQAIKAEQELTPQQRAAKEELKEAARAYKAGRFSDAELHVRRALEVDPGNKLAPFFLARSIHAQYKQGVSTPENVRIAERAIEVYKLIMLKDANNDEAYKAVAFLLGQLERTDERREWIAERAANESVAPNKRAEAYTFLANHAWECSFQITERKENQTTVERDEKIVLTFIKPRDPADFDKAKQCALTGMEFVEKAISLNPESNKAWGFKTNLLLELSKLSEMEGNEYERNAYKREADEAQKRTFELSQKALQAERAKENDSVPDGDRPPPPPPRPANPNQP